MKSFLASLALGLCLLSPASAQVLPSNLDTAPFGAWITKRSAATAVACHELFPATLALVASPDNTGAVEGGTIQTWTDLSANSFDAAQATEAARPTLQLQNGVWVVRFDGTDDFMSLSGGALDMFRNVGSATVFVLWKPPASGRDIAFFAATDSGGTRLLLEKNASNEHSAGGRRLDADSQQLFAGAALGTDYVLSSLVVDWSNAIATLYKDGAQDGQADPFQTAGLTSDTGSQKIEIGTSLAGLFLNGDISDTLAYIPALSEANRQAVETCYSDTVTELNAP